MNRLVVALLAVVLTIGSANGAETTRGVGIYLREGNGVSKEAFLYQKMTAVIIGIDRYSNLGADQQLTMAVKDAKGMEDVLRKHYSFDRIITLYNEEASRERIIKTLQGDLSSLGADDAVLIYFAGHGVTVPTAQKTDLGFLIPHDGSLKPEEMYRNISMQQIKSDISPMIPAKHVLIVADACFGGLLLDTRSASMEASHNEAYLRQITSEPVRQIITAGGRGETVLDGGPGGHSVFAGRMIQALEGVEDFITAKELGVEIQRNVYGDAAARGHQQRPLVGEIYGTGDFVFVPDQSKRKVKAEDEVRALETELAKFEQLSKDAAARQDEAQVRETERQRLVKENELKQARLREQAAQTEADLRAKAEAESRKNAAQLKQREEEQAQRLALLREKAKALQSEVGSPAQALGLEDAVKEMGRINGLLAKLESDYKTELEAQLRPVQEYYDPKITQAAQVKPRDAMFETEADFQARTKRQGQGETALRAEFEAKKKNITAQVQADLVAQRAPLVAQQEAISGQRFVVSGKDVAFKLLKYDPESEQFVVLLNFSARGSIAEMGARLPVPKAIAKEYYDNPDILVPELKLAVSRDCQLQPETLQFQAPGGLSYVAKNFSMIPDVITKMKMVSVKGGCYQMGDTFNAGDGDEKPVHEVCVDDFHIGKYEVTQGQWQAVMGNNPSEFKNGNNNPVENVTWNDTQEFIKKLNAMTGKRYRLPTEAEWEYAARSGGKEERFSGGKDINSYYSKFNSGNSTHRVGMQQPNGLGIYDMSGNVWEWCQDWYGDNYYASSSRNNPQGPSSGASRVGRGGGWRSEARESRTASRSWLSPGDRSGNLGFRLVLPVQ